MQLWFILVLERTGQIRCHKLFLTILLICKVLFVTNVANKPYYALWWREGIVLCICRSVCPSATFLFLINYTRTPWPTFLKLGPQIRPGQQRNCGHWVKGLGHQRQMFQNFSQNEFLLHTFVQLILNCLILTQLYNTFVTKKVFGRLMFYEYLLLVDECAQHVC